MWHDDGRMMATWFQGSADEFIRVSREGWNRGVSILHFLGGSSIDVAGDRAIAQTKMTISQRGDVHGVRCDVVCTGRFYDFFEKRQRTLGRRAAPADLRKGSHRPGRSRGDARSSRRNCSHSFPEGYRHLAYMQTKIGYTVKRDMPGLKGAEVEALYARGRRWLKGEPALA